MTEASKNRVPGPTGPPRGDLERRIAHLSLLADEHAALRRVATLVARDPTPDRVLASVAEEACRVLGARSSLVCRFEDGDECTVLGRWDEREAGGFPVGTTVTLVPEMALHRVRRTGLPARNDGYDTIPGETARTIHALGFMSVVVAPITVAGAIWGAIVVGSDAEEGMSADAAQRLGDFAELAALALSSAEARRQLAASRARIVETGDAERRRLERNLHDGAQQRMVGLSIALRLAQARIRTDPAMAETLLERARTELTHALEELRELARGIHPAVLSHRGLGPALEALASRAPLPVEVVVEDDERLPETIEAAAYYVAAEALTNVAKYADARAATVRVARHGDIAVVEISDVGVGGADPSAGSGLSGLVDRVEALGGSLRVESPPGAGTLVRAELPTSGCPEARSEGDRTPRDPAL